jgi:hypothetical protein
VQVVNRPFDLDMSKPFPAVICPPHTNTLECSEQSPPDRMSQTEVSPERASLRE